LKDDITADEAQLKEKRNQMKEKELQSKENEQQPKAQKRSKEDVNVEKIARLANAFGIEEDRANHAENQNVVSDAVQSEESKAETENHDMAVAFQNAEIQDIWQKYNDGEIQCWHFAALDNGKQAAALGRQPAVLSLIEYGEDWRTERLEQVKENDVLFLFNRGGAGYVGMYRATGGQFIIHNPAEGTPAVFEDGREEKREPTEDEIGRYDIYDAYEDDATYVSDVKVAEIKKLQGDTYNPINVVRQTIARLSPGNVQALLRYFDTAK
ncbi:MAG: hypothetical protein K2O01_02700, partial [Bacteroidales bacterium]|nr:hypothetical protein [Bacteroidales bacterium]